MRSFIKNGLINTRNKNMSTFDYRYEADNGDTITMKGTVKNNIADFTIERTKANGHCCSAVPVYGMPLTNMCREEIAGIAVESL